MKVAASFISTSKRMRAFRKGFISRPQVTLIYDKVNIQDLIYETSRLLRRDPNFDYRGAILKAFEKCPTYLFSDDKKRLWGIERDLGDFEYDITDLFLSVIEQQVIKNDMDDNHFADALNNEIMKTTEYQKARAQLKDWGFGRKNEEYDKQRDNLH